MNKRKKMRYWSEK